MTYKMPTSNIKKNKKQIRVNLSLKHEPTPHAKYMNVSPINKKLFQNGKYFKAYLSQNFDVMDIHAMQTPNKTLKTAHNEK